MGIRNQILLRISNDMEQRLMNAPDNSGRGIGSYIRKVLAEHLDRVESEQKEKENEQ